MNKITIWPDDYISHSGLYTVEAYIYEDGCAGIVDNMDYKGDGYIIPKDCYFLTKEDALEYAIKDREKQIKYHKKQLEKLENLVLE